MGDRVHTLTCLYTTWSGWEENMFSVAGYSTSVPSITRSPSSENFTSSCDMRWHGNTVSIEALLQAWRHKRMGRHGTA